MSITAFIAGVEGYKYTPLYSSTTFLTPEMSTPLTAPSLVYVNVIIFQDESIL